MKDILCQGFPELGISPSEESINNLIRYYALVDKKNKVMNLTAIQGEEATARQHFLDCGAMLKFVSLNGKSVGDVGSGAGFPGLVLKILEPGLSLTMLDSQQKRVTFQQEAVDALGLRNVRCLAGRAEEETELRESFDVVTSRAVARLNMLCELCLPLVKKGGCFVSMKGPDPEAELTEAQKCISTLGGGEARVEKYTIPGTDIVHSLVIIQKVRHTPAQYPRRFALIKKQPL